MSEARAFYIVTRVEQVSVRVGGGALIVTQGLGRAADRAPPFSQGFYRMKTIATVAGLACLVSLAACNRTATENKADNVEAAAENQADMWEQKADNATSDPMEDQLENRADQAREAGENQAEAIRESGENAMGNTTGNRM